MKRKILFRADAGQSIGYGHFIRTLALADMLKDDFECIFYTQAPTEYQKKEMSSVCPYVDLPADESRFDLFLRELKGNEIVVLDNYFYTTDYQQQIKIKGCKLVCIDDMHDKHYVSDVVVNQAIVDRSLFDVEPYTRLCLGFDYAILRKPFLDNKNTKRRNKQIVICFGGADPYRITNRTITLLKQLHISEEIIVVKGDLVYLSEENKRSVTIKNKLSGNQMVELFDSSLFGIISCSTVFLEAMSRNMPVIVGYYVDNQQEYYYQLEKENKVVTIGDLREIDLEKLSTGLSLIKNKSFSFEFNTKDIKKNYQSLFSSF